MPVPVERRATLQSCEESCCDVPCALALVLGVKLGVKLWSVGCGVVNNMDGVKRDLRQIYPCTQVDSTTSPFY
jgi:hypothetical protein